MHQHDPSLLKGVGAVDWHTLEKSFSAEQLIGALVVHQSRLSESPSLQLEWLSVDADAPLGHPFRVLVEQLTDHVVDLLHLFVWIVARLGQQFTHLTRVRPDRVWNTVDDAELRRDLQPLVLTSLDEDNRLLLVRDLETVLRHEVLGDAHFSSISHAEEGTGWALSEVDLVNPVCLPLAIAGDDTLTHHLSLDSLLEDLDVSISHTPILFFNLLLHIIVNLVDAVETGLGGHEAAAGVEDEDALFFVHVG